MKEKGNLPEKKEEKISKKMKKKNRVRFNFAEDKTLFAEIIGAIVVLGLIIMLLAHSCSMKKYTVTFDSMGGTTVTSQKIIDSYKAKKPTNPTKVGYTFEGWYYNDVIFNFDTKITSNIKLEAKWSELAPIDTSKVTSVSLDQTELYLAPKKSITLVATVLPDTAIDKEVTWSSSNAAIATVDSNGKITGVKDGNAVITVTTKDGGFTATANVKVTNDNIAATSVTLNKTSLDLGTGKSEALRATVLPAGATNSAVTWSSSNAGVAKVDANGRVTAVKAGTAVITVTAKDGNFKATCTVTVKDIPVTSVNLNKTTITIVEGRTETLKATVNPTDATNKGVSWSSSDTNIATVNANGVVTAKAAGTATITVTTKDGNKTATVRVTVTERVYSYTYRTTPIQDEAGFVNYYRLCVSQDNSDISSSVTAIYVPAKITVREGNCFRIATIQYNNLANSITADYLGKSITVTKG
jgi:Listeria/Bacterioides repeat